MNCIDRTNFGLQSIPDKLGTLKMSKIACSLLINDLIPINNTNNTAMYILVMSEMSAKYEYAVNLYSDSVCHLLGTYPFVHLSPLL